MTSSKGNDLHLCFHFLLIFFTERKQQYLQTNYKEREREMERVSFLFVKEAIIGFPIQQPQHAVNNKCVSTNHGSDSMKE